MKINRKVMASLSIWLTKTAPFASIILLTVLWFTKLKNVTIDDILNFTPKNPFIAFIVLMILFAVKSLIVFFPVTLLYLSVGAIYSPLWALIINFSGITICLLVPYFLGRMSGQEILDKLMVRYPKTNRYIKPEKANSWTYSYFIRIVNPLPGDLRSMLLGALDVPLKTYITSSIVASIPYLVAVTYVGANIDDPDSPGFITSIIVTGSITLVTILICGFIQKRKVRKKAGEQETKD